MDRTIRVLAVAAAALSLAAGAAAQATQTTETVAGEAQVTLSPDLRRDAGHLFGRR